MIKKTGVFFSIRDNKVLLTISIGLQSYWFHPSTIHLKSGFDLIIYID